METNLSYVERALLHDKQHYVRSENNTGIN